MKGAGWAGGCHGIMLLLCGRQAKFQAPFRRWQRTVQRSIALPHLEMAAIGRTLIANQPPNLSYPDERTRHD
jgi:hypothetical protein